nr:uncharacterized protein CI109_007545 [Kwoniella shandongensis]KAA5524170.1 hypothetical protein CI109_007545 [Kwoniella shandongensis]
MPRPPSTKPPSYLASTAASRARDPRPTASQLFNGPPAQSKAEASAPRASAPVAANPKNHLRAPFVQLDFGICKHLIQTCGDCGTVMKPGRAAMGSHLPSCKGRTDEMIWRLSGGTKFVVREKDRDRSFTFPTIPNLSASGAMRMRVFAGAAPTPSTTPAPAHPTPPSLRLSRDEPRSDPMGPVSPTSPSPSPPPDEPFPQPPPPPPMPRPPPPTPPVPASRGRNPSRVSSGTTATQRPAAPATHLPTAEETQHTVADLLPLPGSIKHLHPNLVRPFVTCVNRLAERYNSEPSEKALFDILALVKVGLVPNMRNGHAAVTERLSMYPEVPWPTAQEVTPGPTRSAAAKAKQMVEAGLIRKAARLLTADAKVAELDDKTIQSLRDKHPLGQESPFAQALRVDSAVPTVPEANDVLLALGSFNPDTSPGPSGWTVKLITLACTEGPFRQFLTTMTAKIASGIMEGKDMLRVARLTPLLKPDGGVRPIAVGEMFYRLAMKAIFTSNFDPDTLSANQFGVGSKGGVETAIHAVQKTIDRHPAFKRFRFLTSLDASNAFNALYRHLLAAAIRKHAPSFLKAVTWSYGTPSQLLVHSNSTTVEIESSEGVKQGDPLGPLLFSLAIKDAVGELQALLGEKYLVLAYLDDIFILGEDEDALQVATEYFGRDGSPLRLNRTKCKQVEIETVRTSKDGFRLLGSCVGSTEARRCFLQEKIGEVRDSLQHLDLLPKQHALLILRLSCHQRLRHLQRTLMSSDLTDLWDNLDNLLWEALDRIRGSGPEPTRSSLDRQLLSLPPAMGGIGLASYREYAPLAYKASSSMAITSLLAIVDGLDEPIDPLSQRELCKEANTIKYNTLMASLPLQDRISVVESASQLGRKWLSAIPSAPRFVIPNAAIQSALLYRTLRAGYQGNCRKCAIPNSLGHDENCTGRSRFIKARHDAIKHRLAAALRSIPGSSVVEEPYILDRLDRLNDIRVTLDDSDNRHALAEEYDLKIVSLFAPTYQEALRSNGKTREERLEVEKLEREGLWGEDAMRRALKVLAQQARRKVTGLPAEERARVEGTGLFTPLVLSTGGLQDEETAAKISEWKRWNMPGASYGWMLMSISVALVRARARTLLVQAAV